MIRAAHEHGPHRENPLSLTSVSRRLSNEPTWQRSHYGYVNSSKAHLALLKYSGSGPAQYCRSSAHRPHRRGNRRCKPERAAAPARARRTEGRAFCGIVACRQGGRYRRGGRLSLPLDCRHATGDPEHLQRGDTCLATYSDGCSILLRRKDHNGQPVLPGFDKREDLVRGAPARMNENRVNSRVCLSVSARDGFLHALPGDQRLNPGHKDQFVVDRILHGAQADNSSTSASTYPSPTNEFAGGILSGRSDHCELTCQGDFCALRASPVGDVLPPALRFQKRVMCDSRALAASNNSVRTISSLPSVILPIMSFSPDWYIFGVSPNSAPASLPSCRPGTRARITQSLRPEERRNFSIGMGCQRAGSFTSCSLVAMRARSTRSYGALDAIINLTMET